MQTNSVPIKKPTAQSSPHEFLEWLKTNPRLEQLIEVFPKQWEEASQEFQAAAQTGKARNLDKAAIRANKTAQMWISRVQKSGNNPPVITAAIPQIVHSRMIILTLDRGYLASAAGKATGKVRFNIFNGFIIQKLLFSHNLIRKPASLRWVKIFWPFLTQRKLLLPLVKDKGIYCFYSRELIAQLAALIGDQSCLEVAAGDGTLTRFLKDVGINIIATDDQSWKYAIEYPDAVENLDAKKALAKYQPSVVLCSWPPPANSFEKHVFNCETVNLYIVIGSCYKFAAGSWETYTQQNNFDWHIDDYLSSLVIPPKAAHAVMIFRRKQTF
ncbi:MAG: SAM-dependent methyltransferase [Deltaproteobacteria bacterium]|nr:SAM-dependent methyltransferase [Deltaproteobacteria bacterium]